MGERDGAMIIPRIGCRNSSELIYRRDRRELKVVLRPVFEACIEISIEVFIMKVCRVSTTMRERAGTSVFSEI